MPVKMRAVRAIALSAALLLGACGLGQSEPTVIDGSSPEAFDRTVAAARAELGPRDRLKFEAALTALRGKQFAATADRAEYGRRIRAALDGQTAPEIVAGVDSWSAKAGTDAADAVFEVKRQVSGDAAR